MWILTKVPMQSSYNQFNGVYVYTTLGTFYVPLNVYVTIQNVKTWETRIVKMEEVCHCKDKNYFHDGSVYVRVTRQEWELSKGRIDLIMDSESNVGYFNKTPFIRYGNGFQDRDGFHPSLAAQMILCAIRFNRALLKIEGREVTLVYDNYTKIKLSCRDDNVITDITKLLYSGV